MNDLLIFLLHSNVNFSFVQRITSKKLFKMAVSSESLILKDHFAGNVEEMPSTKRHISKKDRKRARYYDSEDEMPAAKYKNGILQFRTRELLKAYEEKRLSKNKTQSLQFVPEKIKDLFVPYITHLQTINNNFHSIDYLFKANSKILSSELIDKFKKIVEKTEIKMSKFTNDLIDTLTNHGNDSVYESMKAACKNPIIQLDKLQDSETPKQSEVPQQQEVYDDFIDSDIELQINEVYDNLMNDPKQLEQNQNSEEKKSEPASSDSIQYIKKRELDDVAQRNNFLKNLKYDTDGHLVVYTDGCCLSNGRNSAQAGIGVWFNDNHPLNIALPVKGAATNNNAEIQAATKAVVTASSINVKKIRIYTDSKFLIDCMTIWIHKWKKNNWKTADKSPVKNRESLQELDNVLSLMESVQWQYVAGHKGIIGNEGADKLAKEGAARYVAAK